MVLDETKAYDICIQIAVDVPLSIKIYGNEQHVSVHSLTASYPFGSRAILVSRAYMLQLAGVTKILLAF